MGMDQMDEQAKEPVLSTAEIDAIGEILNISMGSAATAISTMLDRQVIITTPRVEVQRFYDVSYAQLEPAIVVKIQYIEGISGSNVMVFRQSDMQIILNLLMGNDSEPAEDFVFDELSMSAACEVMNQMMGSSATALSEFLGKTINISTPTANILDNDHEFVQDVAEGKEDEIISVSFNLDIDGVMNSDFISIMSISLAKMIVSQVMGSGQEAAPPAVQQAAPAQQMPPQAQQMPQQAQQPLQAQQMPQQVQQPPQAQQMPQQVQQPPQAQQMPPQAQQPPQVQQMPQQAQQPQAQQMPQEAQQMQQMQQQMQQQFQQQQQQFPQQMGYPDMGAVGAQQQMYPYGMYGYPQVPAMPGYGMPMQPQQQQSGVLHAQDAVNVQSAQFPNFTNQPAPVFAAPLTKSNMELVMNVPLSVSVEIGKTKRKIRDIMDFNQGTVIELEKQAGAPVDIVVNGQLIARGDVVVIDDNFGVRITEIVGTKELIDAVNPS